MRTLDWHLSGFLELQEITHLIDSCPHPKVIGVLRAGTENVNVTHATAKGILVYNTPGRNSDSVADFTVGLIICECRNIAHGHHGMKTGRWIRDYPSQGRIPDLPGRTVGLVGLGEIGAKVARQVSICACSATTRT